MFLGLTILINQCVDQHFNYAFYWDTKWITARQDVPRRVNLLTTQNQSQLLSGYLQRGNGLYHFLFRTVKRIPSVSWPARHGTTVNCIRLCAGCVMCSIYDDRARERERKRCCKQQVGVVFMCAHTWPKHDAHRSSIVHSAIDAFKLSTKGLLIYLSAQVCRDQINK